MLLQGTTAWGLLTHAVSNSLKPGDWILVHAAAGGVGQLLTQMAKNRLHLNVIGTSSTSKLNIAKQVGCDHVIDYTVEDVPTKVKEITRGKGVAAVFDGVGKSTYHASLNSLARDGYLISFGNASGKVPPVDIYELAKGNYKLSRYTNFNYTGTREDFMNLANPVLDMLKNSELKPSVYRVYSFEDIKQVRDSHMDLEGRKTTGKLLLGFNN